ncbi:PIG-L deacetylase family protein [Kitasatospora sp. NPDC004799]|uniref:PIG-L deacetylase family protein n=1 Tax=Kitasatospora sp. NPDC004799 TaxID=3154460 RepID=UPI0033B56DA9
MTPPVLGMWAEAHRRSALSSRTVLVFAPHPDDEVIACGGTIAGLAAEGARVRIVFATDGAMSHSAVLGIHQDPTPAELRLIRRREARAAARVLGLAEDAVEFLDFPDTALADHLEPFRARVLDVLRGHPGVAEVYLPHEVRELNADHRLTGETVLACLAELGLTPAVRRYVVWDERTEEEFAFVNRNPPSATAGTSERRVAVDITEQLPRKRAALREHRTQVELFAPGQTRPVVPEPFQERILTSPVEEFWITEPAPGRQEEE